MNSPRFRFSIFTMLVLVALVGGVLTAWRHWVFWPAQQERLGELILVSFPKPQMVDEIETMVRHNPALMNQQGLMTWAAMYGSSEFCEDLLDAGCDPNESSENGPVIVWAVILRRVEIVTELLEHGADVNALCTNNGQSLLTIAAKLGDMPMCVELIEHGADVSHVSYEGFYVLHGGVISRNHELVEYLIRSGSTYAPPFKWYTPLEYAVGLRDAYGNHEFADDCVEVIRVLAEHFPDEADKLERKGEL